MTVYERPMIFSAVMVNAATVQLIKTVTRRLDGLQLVNKKPDDWMFLFMDGKSKDGKWMARFKCLQAGMHIEPRLPCPYGAPGDVIWVRENYAFGTGYDGVKPADVHYVPGLQKVWYGADGPLPSWAGRTRPSIHMPRVVARHFLKVADIGIERLQDITFQQALAEGVARQQTPNDGEQYYHYLKDKWGPSPLHSFETLWRKLNGDDSWELNPWVWAISFNILNDYPNDQRRNRQMAGESGAE